MDVLATVERVFAPLAQSVPDYRFVGVVDPIIQVLDTPSVPPLGLPYATGFIVVEGGEAPCYRDQVFEGFEVRVRVFGTEVTARCAADQPDDVIVRSLVDSIMEYLPEEFALETHLDVSWPGCLPGHKHPPRFETDLDEARWVCPVTGETVQTIAMVP
jgi:hypothetical protein